MVYSGPFGPMAASAYLQTALYTYRTHHIAFGILQPIYLLDIQGVYYSRRIFTVLKTISNGSSLKMA